MRRIGFSGTDGSCYKDAVMTEEPLTVFGLTQLRVKAAESLLKYAVLEKDLFYAPEFGPQMQTLISCNAQESVPSPHCEQMFIFAPMNASVVLRYRRTHLKDWREMEVAVQKLLDSLITE
jgi:hypothetical protein